MADNFNLRSFLTENKLTKNAKILSEGVELNGKPIDYQSIEIDGIDTSDYPDFVDAYISYAEYADGTPLTDEELVQFQEENYDLVSELIHDNQLYLQEKKESVEEASYKVSKNSKQAQHLKKGDIIGSGDEVVSVSAGAKTPAGKVEVTLKTKNGSTKTSTWGKTTMIGVKPVEESKLTAREARLVEMVQAALGEENVDYTIGRQDDPNQLPNPAPELNIAEDEMVQEKPLPKYENIEKLMQEIEHGTNEAAHKYKKEKMKEIAEMLEARVGSLEEGEGAEFVDAKKVKQMKKDIMTLRKQAEKLEKEYDKKFGEKKSKKETQTENKIENFNLKKFLSENRLTTNSKGLTEEIKQGNINLPGDVKGELDILFDSIIETFYEEIGIEMESQEEVEAYKYLIGKLQANLEEAQREL